jgi:hypothetical protein
VHRRPRDLYALRTSQLAASACHSPRCSWLKYSTSNLSLVVALACCLCVPHIHNASIINNLGGLLTMRVFQTSLSYLLLLLAVVICSSNALPNQSASPAPAYVRPACATCMGQQIDNVFIPSPALLSCPDLALYYQYLCLRKA